MTDLRDPIDDLIRDVVHRLVTVAPDPKPLAAGSTEPRRPNRRLATAAALLLVGGAAVTALVMVRDDAPGAIVSEPDPATTIGSPATSDDAPGCPEGYQCVGADVTDRTGSEASDQRVFINRGAQHGIRVGMAVVNADGLVGKVVRVEATTAQVMLLTDAGYVQAFGISDIYEEVITGRGPDRLPTVAAVPGPTVSITGWHVGDEVTTAGGSENAFPPISIGHIVKLLDEGSTMAEIEPAADLRGLDRVSVLLVVPAVETADRQEPEPTPSVPQGSSSTTVPSTNVAPIEDVPVADGWRMSTLTGADGEPWITTDAPRHLIEIGDRRLILGTSPSGCCFTGLDAWIDEGGWRWVDLGAELGMDPTGTVMLGAGPAAAATDDSTAVAVGALVDDLDGVLSSRPAAWISTDLVDWDVVVLPGQGRLDGIVRRPTGWVAVGTIDDEQVIVHSTDGLDWQIALGAGGRTFDLAPTIVAAGTRAIVEFGDGRRVWSDRGLEWSDLDPPGDPILIQAGRTMVGLGPERARWTHDGTTWEPLETPPAELVSALDPSFAVPADVTMVGGTESVAIVVGGTLWIGSVNGWEADDLGDVFGATPWGPGTATALSVRRDGTLVLLGVVPEEPLNKPVGAATVWTHDPIGPPPPTTVAALPFAASGTAEQICTDAANETRPWGDPVEGFVFDDRTSLVDGVETRWLFCTGDPASSGWSVTAVVQQGQQSWIAYLGLGNFVHAGDGVDVETEGAVATVFYRSLVFESANGSTASTVDGGRTWTVRQPPTTVTWARNTTVAELLSRGYLDIGGDHDVAGSATFGVQDPSGGFVTGSFRLGAVEPIGDLPITDTTTVEGRDALVLGESSLFVACRDVGVTVDADQLDRARPAMSVALDQLGC